MSRTDPINFNTKLYNSDNILWIDLLNGLKVFQQTKVTPPEAYQSMIKLHCKTNGIVTELLHEILKSKENTYLLNNKSIFDERPIKSHLGNIIKQSFSVFEDKLPQSKLNEILSFALKNKCRSDSDRSKKILFNPLDTTSSAFRFDEEDLVGNKIFQDLMTEPLFLKIARDYLECNPILCSVNLWWSSMTLEPPSSEAAQLYHFDMSRAKWINIFVYITNVDSNSGPHCVVKGSHVDDGKRMKLLERGYARISDKEINQVYNKSYIKELTGPAGTIIFEDTKAFHKGKKPTKANRLIFELSFASSLFGGEYKNIDIQTDLLEPSIKKTLLEQKEIFSRYKVTNS